MIKEVERCAKLGLKGAMIWGVLPEVGTDHGDLYPIRFWWRRRK